LGATVLVYDMEMEEEWEISIVDFISADPMNDKIAYSSPMGQALVGKKSDRNRLYGVAKRHNAVQSFGDTLRIEHGNTKQVGTRRTYLLPLTLSFTKVSSKG